MRTKTNFKRNLEQIHSAFMEGNSYWFDSSEDVEFHSSFQWKGRVYTLHERVGYTNGGANFSSVTIHDEDGVLVYSDHAHDGNGAWQTGDGNDARCEYSIVTIAILKILKMYL